MEATVFDVDLGYSGLLRNDKGELNTIRSYGEKRIGRLGKI